MYVYVNRWPIEAHAVTSSSHSFRVDALIIITMLVVLRNHSLLVRFYWSTV